MDFVQPLAAVFPGASAAVLTVLARTERPLALRQIAERAGISHPQVARVVDRLEGLGIVRREVVGRSHQVLLGDGAVGTMVRRLVHVDHEVLEQMRATASCLEPNAVSVLVFGSFARGSADALSDIDVAVIASDPTSDEWLAQLSDWVDRMSEYSGSPVAEILISIDELLERRNEPLWNNVRADGIVIVGRPLDQVIDGHQAGATA